MQRDLVRGRFANIEKYLHLTTCIYLCAMKEFADQLGRKITLASTPKRIVSIVPSQTELLYDLGLHEEVIGITKFCIHPDSWFRKKAKVGGTKSIDVEKIKQLAPDLIIGNKEENEQSLIADLMNQYPVWMSDVKNLDEAFKMIELIGDLVGKKNKSLELTNQIKQQFNQLSHHPFQEAGNLQVRIAYLIWKGPLMVAGDGSFIDDMISRCGFTNVFSNKKRYPEITSGELAEASPELILLSSEPYPFKEKDIREFLLVCPGSKILLVDGELISWYGSRLLKAPDYFRSLVKQIQFSN